MWSLGEPPKNDTVLTILAVIGVLLMGIFCALGNARGWR